MMTISSLLLAASLLQQPDGLAEMRRAQAKDTPLPTREELLALRSPRITPALQHPESLYAFITRPEPLYLERRAAAVQSKGLIPMDWVPRLWRARGELRAAKGNTYWWMKEHPLYPHAINLSWLTQEPRPGTALVILGHRWTSPAQPTDHPLTPAEREAAPWPWQVEQALDDLYSGLVPSTFAPLDRPKAEAYLAAVSQMPCRTDVEAQLFVEATQYSSHFKTPVIMGALRNIALNPDHGMAAIHVTTGYADDARLWNDSLAWAIGVAGTLDILRDTPHGPARDNAAYHIRSLREAFRYGGTEKRPVPAAVVLEGSRRALDVGSRSEWDRLYVYAFSVIEALDDPPFPAERNMSPESPMVGQRLAEFGRWFTATRPSLESLAATQAPALDAARRAMETSRCR